MNENKYQLKLQFQQVDINAEEFLIGRSSSCNLSLDDPLLSRRHVKIRITSDGVLLDDLGSRNGTLVNNEPIFSNYLLTHKDRIRIGSQDMIFVVASPNPVRKHRLSPAMTKCPDCKVPFPLGLQQCPHCDYSIKEDTKCPTCSKPASFDEVYCSRCGAQIKTEETTIPVDLSGELSGWSSSRINRVIEKAIAQNSYEHAASLLEGKIEEYNIKEKKGLPNIAALIELTGHNLLFAKKLEQPARLEWIIDKWISTSAVMPSPLFHELAEQSCTNNAVQRKLDIYLDTLRVAQISDEKIADLLQLLKEYK